MAMDLDIRLDRKGHGLLSHQLGRALIELIGRGALPTGSALPSTRDLARQLGVARMTVVDAYSWLDELGYVQLRDRAAARVRALALPPQEKKARDPVSQSPKKTGCDIDFRLGVPDLTKFPRKEWLAGLVQAGRHLPDDSLGYGDVAGHPRLREAIANYLGRSRGLQASASNIIVTAGTGQSVDILLRALSPLDEIIVEHPGPEALLLLPDIHGVKLNPIPVDEQGLVCDLLPRDRARRLAYVTPSHQVPLGSMMSMERRLALIAWAQASDAHIVEDDYDSEFAYDGRPAVPLAQLDRSGRVIYAGTFSKTLAPSLRSGFIMVPDPLLERVAALKRWADYGGGTLKQEALADWIENGLFERHIRRMRLVYQRKFETLVTALRTALGDRVRIVGRPVGMHTVAVIRSDTNPDRLVARARANNLCLYPSPFSARVQETGEIGLVFGFGNLQPDRIEAGVKILARLLHEDD